MSILGPFPKPPTVNDSVTQRWFQDIYQWLSGATKRPADTTIQGKDLGSGAVNLAMTDIPGTLPHAQLPSLVSGDIPNNAADTSGNAATATLASTVTTVTEPNFAFTDIATANVDATKHGLFPRLPIPSGKFLRDDLTWQVVAVRGLATLVGGTIVVNAASVAANSLIFLTPQNTSGGLGSVSVSARVVGVSFTILSTNILDTRDIAWIIFTP